MNRQDYRRALEAAIKEYEQLRTQRDAIETRLAQLRLTIANLGALCGLPSERLEQPELGLTDACRSVLRASFGGLTAAQVRERLTSLGIDPDRYSNPLASIHIVLKRLVAAGEIWTYKTRDGKPVYAWKRAAVPYAVSDPELAHAIVTGGLMWPGAVEVPVKAASRKKARKKQP
ncbi:MAG TPA: hypothetical protein VHJ77_06490 [Vicinamibacterales bacterium]|nr:hypothetical protein [Vicinamibacterales bacterium]